MKVKISLGRRRVGSGQAEDRRRNSLVVRTSRCGRENPGSNPGYGRQVDGNDRGGRHVGARSFYLPPSDAAELHGAAVRVEVATVAAMLERVVCIGMYSFEIERGELQVE